MEGRRSHSQGLLAVVLGVASAQPSVRLGSLGLGEIEEPLIPQFFCSCISSLPPPTLPGPPDCPQPQLTSVDVGGGCWRTGPWEQPTG